MRTYSSWIFAVVLLCGIGVATPAAEPQTIHELKAYFATVATDKGAYTADYTITMNKEEANKSEAEPIDELARKGKVVVRGDALRMTMSVGALEDRPALNVAYTAVINVDNIMHMQVETPTAVVPPMKIDLDALGKMAEKLGLPFGVPAAALGSEEMSAGLMIHPTKLLVSLGKMYDLKMVGKESLRGEGVYVIESRMKAETLQKYKKKPNLQWMFDVEQRIYMGSDDGVLRKMTSGGIRTMELTNIDFGANIEDKDFVLTIPEGAQEIDMTEELLGSFADFSDDDSFEKSEVRN